MDYMTIKEAAEKWGLSIRRIQDVCKENKIPGVMKFGTAWAIPRDADLQIKELRAESILSPEYGTKIVIFVRLDDGKTR